MLIKIGNFEYTEVWDGVLYKKLSDYPNITDWEVRTLIEFIDYEKSNGRACKIECDDKDLLKLVHQKLNERDKYCDTPRPKLITECTACPHRKGCVTEFVCHTTSPENAVKIFQSGKLLSASLARGVPSEQLVKEKRNAANDPADYFNYVMLAWGNCQSGDRLVMERKLGRFPNETDLSTHFTPGIRFFFRYDDLVNHPQRVFDGVLPFKIKDGIDLSEWVYAIVIPAELKKEMEPIIPLNLKNKVLYI
ncbi:MAG: hypothetical protein K2N74_02635 [Clostridiales bacterium]|nr:hypothetical protein [Clostridiales bacterium]